MPKSWICLGNLLKRAMNSGITKLFRSRRFISMKRCLRICYIRRKEGRMLMHPVNIKNSKIKQLGIIKGQSRAESHLRNKHLLNISVSLGSNSVHNGVHWAGILVPRRTWARTLGPDFQAVNKCFCWSWKLCKKNVLNKILNQVLDDVTDFKRNVSRPTATRHARGSLVLSPPITMRLEKAGQVLFPPLFYVIHVAHGWSVRWFVAILWTKKIS